MVWIVVESAHVASRYIQEMAATLGSISDASSAPLVAVEDQDRKRIVGIPRQMGRQHGATESAANNQDGTV
jgi:hypothetical protein